MKRNLIKKEPTTEIRLAEKVVHLPSKILHNLPKIVRNEVENPIFKESGRQVDVLNQIVRMLNVNFLDEEDRRTSGGLWIEFVSRYRLTAPEVIDAYYKALQRELLNDKGEPVKLFPNLSLITAGEVMDGFIKYKRSSVAYEEGKKRLKLALNPKIEKEETEEEREARIKETIKEIKTEIQNGSYYDGAFVIYNDLRKSGVLSEFIPQPEEIKALQQKLMLQFLAKEKKRRFLLDVNTIKKLNKLADLDKPLPVHHLINLDIKSQIVHNYVKKNFLNRK